MSELEHRSSPAPSSKPEAAAPGQAPSASAKVQRKAATQQIHRSLRAWRSPEGDEVSQPAEPAELEAEEKSDASEGGPEGAEAKGADGADGAAAPEAAAKQDAGGAPEGEAKASEGEAAPEAEAKSEAESEEPTPVAAKRVSAKLKSISRKIHLSPAPGPGASANKKPSSEAEYKALPGFAEFSANTAAIGVTPAESFGFWKGCMDQLFVNEAAVAAIGNDKTKILAHVDSAGARGGFTAMADAMLKKFPLDMNGEYALWSGKNAEVFAQGSGCQVLEGTQLGSLFNGVKTAFSNNWNVMQGLWRAISDAYARKIAEIMLGKPIKVFMRKEGDIFGQVESPAITEVQDKVKAKPTFEYHPIACDGTFSGESSYDGTPNNTAAREELVKAADPDATKGLTKATAESQKVGLKIFDFGGGPVPAGSLSDRGACASGGAAMGVLGGLNAATQAKVDLVKTALAKKP